DRAIADIIRRNPVKGQRPEAGREPDNVEVQRSSREGGDEVDRAIADIIRRNPVEGQRPEAGQKSDKVEVQRSSMTDASGSLQPGKIGGPSEYTTFTAAYEGKSYTVYGAVGENLKTKAVVEGNELWDQMRSDQFHIRIPRQASAEVLAE